MDPVLLLLLTLSTRLPALNLFEQIRRALKLSISFLFSLHLFFLFCAAELKPNDSYLAGSCGGGTAAATAAATVAAAAAACLRPSKAFFGRSVQRFFFSFPVR